MAAFWAIVDEARPSSSSSPEVPSADPERLKAVLDTLPNTEINEFAVLFGHYLDRLNHWRIWNAGDIIDAYGALSGDRFHYFRSWLIGKGRAAVEQALADPDGLGIFIDDPDEIESESLEYAAVDLCEERGLADPRNGYEQDADRAPDGESLSLDALAKNFPRLVAHFGLPDW